MNNHFEKIFEDGKKDFEDIYEIVPREIIQSDKNFVNYIQKHIEKYFILKKKNI